MALDIGVKRTGIAVTDPLQLIATGLEGVDTSRLLEYLKKYMSAESVDCIVVGKPKQLDNSMSESWVQIEEIAGKVKAAFPNLKMDFFDERFTSKMAMQSMKMAGAGKEQMKNKKTIDKVSATILLQGYLEYIKE